MLGSRLMKKANFNTDFETQTLELLKLRFLESELHHCDVMLKDMQVRPACDTSSAQLVGQVSEQAHLEVTNNCHCVQQSRRHVQALMHPDQASEFKLMRLQPQLQRLSVLICSHLFWPKIPDASLQLELPGVTSTACLTFDDMSLSMEDHFF
jgi:N-acetyl-beta-hexosaminidase